MTLQRFARVGIDIKAREVAAGNIHADTMTFLEKIRGGIQLDLHLIDRARLHQLLALQ